MRRRRGTVCSILQSRLCPDQSNRQTMRASEENAEEEAELRPPSPVEMAVSMTGEEVGGKGELFGEETETETEQLFRDRRLSLLESSQDAMEPVPNFLEQLPELQEFGELKQIQEQQIPTSQLKEALLSQEAPIAKRTRAIFLLRAKGGEGAIEALGCALTDESVLLAHEAAFALGQMRDEAAVPILECTLRNDRLNPIVRHEAAEALGAIAAPSTLTLLKEYEADSAVEVADTCKIASARVEWAISAEGKAAAPSKLSPYDTVDPAPAYSPAPPLKELESKLLDDSLPLFDRYRSMFTLRNIGSDEAVQVLLVIVSCDGFFILSQPISIFLDTCKGFRESQECGIQT